MLNNQMPLRLVKCGGKMRKRVVITGGSGYMGSVPSQLLVDAYWSKEREKSLNFADKKVDIMWGKIPLEASSKDL